jgi:hypothetical protein
MNTLTMRSLVHLFLSVMHAPYGMHCGTVELSAVRRTSAQKLPRVHLTVALVAA